MIKRMQIGAAHQPVGIAPEQARAKALRRQAWNNRAIGKARAHNIILPAHTERAVPQRHNIQFAGKLRPRKPRVALGVNELLQLRVNAAGVERIAAERSREPLGNIAVIARVKQTRIKAEGANSAAQAKLDRTCAFLLQIGIADFKGGGRIMRAFGKQLQRLWRALHILRGEAGHNVVRQILQHTSTHTAGQKMPRARGFSHRISIG